MTVHSISPSLPPVHRNVDLHLQRNIISFIAITTIAGLVAMVFLPWEMALIIDLTLLATAAFILCPFPTTYTHYSYQPIFPIPTYSPLFSSRIVTVDPIVHLSARMPRIMNPRPPVHFGFRPPIQAIDPRPRAPVGFRPPIYAVDPRPRAPVGRSRY